MGWGKIRPGAVRGGSGKSSGQEQSWKAHEVHEVHEVQDKARSSQGR